MTNLLHKIPHMSQIYPNNWPDFSTDCVDRKIHNLNRFELQGGVWRATDATTVHCNSCILHRVDSLRIIYSFRFTVEKYLIR